MGMIFKITALTSAVIFLGDRLVKVEGTPYHQIIRPTPYSCGIEKFLSINAQRFHLSKGADA
jgi:hypothetical protein